MSSSYTPLYDWSPFQRLLDTYDCFCNWINSFFESPPPPPIEEYSDSDEGFESGFKILNLPYLALHECLSSFSPLELIELSLCSKKAKSIVRFNAKSLFKNSKITALIDENCYIKFGKGSEFTHCVHVVKDYCINDEMDASTSLLYTNRNQKRRINGKLIWAVYQSIYPNVLTTYWDDPIVGIRILMDHISDVFRSSFRIEMLMEFERQDSKLGNWIKGRNKTISSIEFRNPNQRIQYSIQYFQKINALIFNGRQKEIPTTKIEANILHFLDAKWIESTDLPYLNSKNLNIFGSKLKEKHVNQFLKKWVSGSEDNSNLDTLLIEIRGQMNLMKVLEGLDYVLEENEWFHARLGRIHPSYNITRKDQTKVASVFELKNEKQKYIGVTIWTFEHQDLFC
uniref:F-box domain-containing protein n=1 Tax=Caenorhabditis tropicalis TaxID=1561998 RepID=A0A1I7TU77_9PELO